MSSKKVTIQDIARVAGTSVSTVSRVLTGSARVAEDKRATILQAIDELDYRPSLLARSLKTRTTHSIGLFINDILNPFYSAVAKGVEDSASAAGYSVIFCNTNEDKDRELNYLRTMHDKSVDGVVLVPTGANLSTIEEMKAAGIALVQLDRQLPGLSASSVTLDNEQAGYLATNHLIAQGHRSIALVTYLLNQPTVARREAGYRRALAEAGIAASPNDICRVNFDQRSTPGKVSKLLQSADPPTALLATNNRIAIGVLQALRETGVRVPDDVAVVAFDDLEIFAISTPSITAVAQPAYTMGQKAADLLLEELGSKDHAPVQTIVFQGKLIVRESSGPHRPSTEKTRTS